MTPQDILTRGHVFPLGNNRKPLIKWRKGSAKGSASFPNHKGPWGLDCGKSHLVVVDADHKDGKAEGVANLAQLNLPETYTVRTRTGGLHLYFHNPAGQPPVANSASKIAKHVDVRGEGGYVVVYEEVVNAAPIAKLPDHLRELAGTVEPREAADITALIDLDQPKNIHAAIEYLRTAQVAVEGDAGDLTTLRVAMRLKDLGLSPEAALEAMLGDWNDRCDPPWDADELQRKVINAYEYGRNAPGSATREHLMLTSSVVAEGVFSDIPAQDPIRDVMPKVDDEDSADEDSADEEDDFFGDHKEVEDDSAPVPASSFAFGNAPARKWLIKDWIPLKCVASVYGSPGIGKSLVAVEMGLCISNGVDWYGNRVDHPSPVLYVSCEDDSDELHHRLDAARNKEAHKEYAGREDDFHIWDRVGKDSLLSIMTNVGHRRQKFLDKLESELAKIAPEGEHRVAILDTVTDMGNLNENDRASVNYFLKFVLGGISTRQNCNVIFLAHPSKGGDYSGSTNWQGSVRAQIFLKWHEADPDLRWISKNKTNRSQRDMSEDSGILVRWVNGAFVEQDIDQFERDLKAQQKRAIFNYLAQNEGIKRAHQSNNPLKNHSMRDENGCEIAFDRIKLLINEMLMDGSLREDPADGLIAENFDDDEGDPEF